MEKKEYIKPIVEVIYLEDKDIITASNEYDPNGDLEGESYPWFGWFEIRYIGFQYTFIF